MSIKLPAWFKAERKIFKAKSRARRRKAPSPDGTRRPKEVLKKPAKDSQTQAMLDALALAQQNTLDQLAILRQTRGKRQVEAVKIPAHLQQPVTYGGRADDPNSDAGVEVRGDIAPGRIVGE